MRGKLRSLAHSGTASLLLANGISLALGLVSAALLARTLGPTGRGEVAAAIAPATVIGIILGFGLPDFFARHTALGADQRQSSATAATLCTLLAVIFLAPYLLLAQYISPVGSHTWYILIIYALATPGIVYANCTNAINMGAGHWRTVSATKVAPQILAIAGLIGLSVDRVTPVGAGTCLVLATLFGTLIPSLIRGILPQGMPSLTRLRDAMSFGLRGWPAGSLALINQRVDILMLTVLVSKESLGYYAVATTLAAILGTIGTSVALPVRNRVARGESSVMPACAAVTMFCTFLVAVCSIPALPIAVRIVLGVSFLPSLPIMVILMLAQAPLAAIVILTNGLIGRGKPSTPLFGETSALIVTVVLVLVLVPDYGVVAAAAANLAGNLVSLAVLIWSCRRHITNVSLGRYVLPSRANLRTIREGMR